MIGRQGLICAIVVAGIATASAAYAGSFGQLLSTKGIVTAKGERSLAIRESGGGVLHVIVTAQTKIGGQRSAFAHIAVSDIVRAEGTQTAARVLTAQLIEVVFAVESTERSRAKRANTLWEWIKNGGITIDLP